MLFNWMDGGGVYGVGFANSCTLLFWYAVGWVGVAFAGVDNTSVLGALNHRWLVPSLFVDSLLGVSLHEYYLLRDTLFFSFLFFFHHL